MSDAMIDWTVILEDIFSAINQAVLLLDVNGEIIYSSSAVLKVFGYSPEHMIGESLALVFTKEDMQHLYPNLLFLARKGQTFEGEIMLKRKNEVNFFAYIILKPCFDPNLNKTIIAACVQDIDRQKQFERIIRETRFEDLVKVANGVAHELRNPLVGIGGFAKRLLASCQANEAQKKYYDFIMNNVTKIEKIVKKINALVTMPKPVYAEESLEDLIGMAIESYREIMRRKNIDLVLMTEPMRIRLDRDMISNAISILIENAIDAISEPGIDPYRDRGPRTITATSGSVTRAVGNKTLRPALPLYTFFQHQGRWGRHRSGSGQAHYGSPWRRHRYRLDAGFRFDIHLNRSPGKTSKNQGGIH